MPRRKLIPDTEVLEQVLDLLLRSGGKAVTFAGVAERCKLAPSTLVQRYRSCAAMEFAALVSAWDLLDHLTVEALDGSIANAKGVQSLLKTLSSVADVPALLVASQRHTTLVLRAKSWRATVEQALSIKLGNNGKSADAAAVMFAAWQGRQLWDSAGGKGFKLGEVLKWLV